MNYLKLLLLIGFAIIIYREPWSQIKITNKIDLHAKEWTQLFMNDQLLVEYKIESCYPTMGYDQDKLLLRLTNESDTQINVNWHTLLEYDGECKTCIYPGEYTYSVSILPNSITEGDCSLGASAALSYFSRFIDRDYTGNPVQLTGFELFGLQISTFSR